MRVNPQWSSDEGAMEGLALLSQHGTLFLRRPRGIHFCLRISGTRKNLGRAYAFSMFVVSRCGNLSTNSQVRRQKRFQTALRKFQRFTRSL